MTRERMIGSAVLPKKWLKTDAGRAAVAQAWVDGNTQKRIAKTFGYKGPAPVNVAIAELCCKYVPEHRYDRYRDGSVLLPQDASASAPTALKRYRARRIAQEIE